MPMIRWAAGIVKTIKDQRGDCQEIVVETEGGMLSGALHYTDVWPPVQEGDAVVLNVTASELGLGSGGFHIVHHVASRQDSGHSFTGEATVPSGHIMKLRYTPLQRAVLAAEEPGSPYHLLFREPLDLQGMPVLIGELHSMLPVAAAWLKATDPTDRCRLSYIMTDGAALPLVYSRHAAELKTLGWLQGTVTYGHAYGGDTETVNKFTALLAARHIHQADLAVVTMGPGIVGTGTPLGHTATETAELIHAVDVLGGRPVLIPRLSGTDVRPRHRGLSHHALTVLGRLTLARAIVPLPSDVPEKDRAFVLRQLQEQEIDLKHDIRWIPGITPERIRQRLEAYPLPVTTMGRGWSDDPLFFAAVCAAAELARSLVRTAV